MTNIHPIDELTKRVYGQSDHVAFARLPRKTREAAYQQVRERVGPSGMVTVSEMLFVATEM